MPKIGPDGTPSDQDSEEIVTNAVGEQFDLSNDETDRTWSTADRRKAEAEQEQAEHDNADRQAERNAERADDGEDPAKRPGNETPAFLPNRDKEARKSAPAKRAGAAAHPSDKK
jgi:hypothetical protein